MKPFYFHVIKSFVLLGSKYIVAVFCACLKALVSRVNVKYSKTLRLSSTL